MLALVFSHLSRTAEQGFCEGARLPQNGNRRVYLTAYYIACLPESVPTRKEQLARALRCVDGSVGVAPVVVAPDMHALRDAVVGARHVGRVCDDIRLFKVTYRYIKSPLLTPPYADIILLMRRRRASRARRFRRPSGARWASGPSRCSCTLRPTAGRPCVRTSGTRSSARSRGASRRT